MATACTYPRGMAPDRIRALLKAIPFKPFHVELPSGKRVLVKHSDYALLSPAGRTLVVHDDDDSMEIIDLFLISNVSMEQADPTHV
jgi:hypothetical protein